jgi:hypothetical protein
MTKESRITSFGAAAVLVVAGLVCLVAVGGGTGQILALGLIGLGLVLATSLVFLEVGLSEDRALARERKSRSRPRDDGKSGDGETSRGDRPTHGGWRASSPTRGGAPARGARLARAKPDRSRSHRRRLR